MTPNGRPNPGVKSRRARTAPRGAVPGLRASLLEHGGSWLAGLAAVSGVLVTVWLAVGLPADGGLASPSAESGKGTLPEVRSYAELIAQVEQVSLPAADDYVTYKPISDMFGTLTVEFPDAWNELDGSTWLADFEDREIGVAVVASTDLDTLYDGWGVPGAFVSASEELATTSTPDEVLDWRRTKYEASCSFRGRGDFVGAAEIGRYEIWTACGDGPTIILVLMAVPRERSLIEQVNLRLTSRADLEAARHIFDTLDVGDQMYVDTDRGLQAPGYTLP